MDITLRDKIFGLAAAALGVAACGGATPEPATPASASPAPATMSSPSPAPTASGPAAKPGAAPAPGAKPAATPAAGKKKGGDKRFAFNAAGQRVEESALKSGKNDVQLEPVPGK